MKKKFSPIKIIFSLVLPIAYVMFLYIFKEPDLIIFKLGIFGFPIYIVQWIGFLIGGWILATLFTIILFISVGCLIGTLVESIINYFVSKHIIETSL